MELFYCKKFRVRLLPSFTKQPFRFPGKTAQSVKRLRLDNPKIKAVEMARILGVSRERVRQLLIKLDLPTRVAVPKSGCLDCSEPVNSGTKRCEKCREVWRKSLRIEVTCGWCGKKMIKLKSEWTARKPRFFSACSQAHGGKLRTGKLFRNGEYTLTNS